MRSNKELIISSLLSITKKGKITDLELPLKLQENEKKQILSFLTRMEYNRKFRLKYYKTLEEKIKTVQKMIKHNVNK